MSTQPRRLLILRWIRNHRALGAPAPGCSTFPLPAHRTNRPGSSGVAAAWASGQLGCRGGLGTPLARRAA
jgi:hypothetical protein